MLEYAGAAGEGGIEGGEWHAGAVDGVVGAAGEDAAGAVGAAAEVVAGVAPWRTESDYAVVPLKLKTCVSGCP